MAVNVRDNNLEFALRRFKTEVAKSGTLSAYRDKIEYKINRQDNNQFVKSEDDLYLLSPIPEGDKYFIELKHLLKDLF